MAMGVLAWLFGQKAGRLRAAEVVRDVSDRFMSLPERDFAGHFSASPNGRYRVAWGRGTDPTGGLAGSSPAGRYFLLEGNTVLAEGQMKRPEDGRVANNGNFIISDWQESNALSGSLLAFDRAGREIISRHFNANLFNNGLSPDGRFAACHTCNSDDPDDSSVLTIFDLSTGRELARWYAESGWPNSYEFSEDGKTVGLGYKDLGIFRYSLNGEFIDREAWIEACLTKADYGTTILMADSLIKAAGRKLSTDLAIRLISSLDRILPQLETADAQWRALGLKLRGMCLEVYGSPAEALACYETALELNPKIGVKRRADQLRKRHDIPAI